MFQNPMLAKTVENSAEYTFPAYVSEKLDGVRCIIGEGKMVTRTNHSFKPGMLEVFAELIEKATEAHVILDGEIYFPNDDFGSLMSLISSSPEKIREIGLKFYCFDLVKEEEWNGSKSTPFSERYADLVEFGNKIQLPNLYVAHKQVLCTNATESEALYDVVKEQGGEGIMIRSPKAVYSHKRTMDIVKRKVWLSCEARIVSIQQQACPVEYAEYIDENGNGFKNTTGALTVEILPDQPLQSGRKQNCTFTGDYGIALRKEIWENRAVMVGRCVEFVYLKGAASGRMARVYRLRPDKD